MKRRLTAEELDNGHHPYKDQLENSGKVEDKSPLSRTAKRRRMNGWSILLAAVLVGLIVFAIFYIRNKSDMDPGLYEIAAEEDKTVPGFQLNTHLRYQLTGSRNKVRNTYDQLVDDYSDALKHVYAELSPSMTYAFCTNIASINQNLGQELKISRDLYDTLKDADRLTRENRGFNLYAGALYTEWYSILYSSDPYEYDPVINSAEAERISRLAEAAANPDNFQLTFSDEDACTVCLTVSDEYLSLVQEMELADAPILDLNILQEAYKLQLVAGRLQAKGYRNGFLYGDNGVSITFSDYTGENPCLLDGLLESGIQAAAQIPVNAGCCGCRLLCFPLSSDSDGYYGFKAADKVYYRYPTVPSDGAFRDVLLSAFVRSDSLTAPELFLEALQLSMKESDEEIKTAARSFTDCSAALLLRDDLTTIWVTDPELLINRESNYTVEVLP